MAIQKGDKCPIFSLPDQNNNMVNMENLIGTKNLIIYFYPKEKLQAAQKKLVRFGIVMMTLRIWVAKLLVFHLILSALTRNSQKSTV